MAIKRNKYLFVLLGLIIIGGIVVTQFNSQQKPALQKDVPYLKINNAIIKVEVVTSDDAKQRGLSYRESLAQDTGMLFIYDQPRQHTFWMYEMNFPLDFIWIYNNKVADITENVPEPAKTFGKPMTIAPKVPVTQILEVNAGWIKKNKITVGDQVEYHNIVER